MPDSVTAVVLAAGTSSRFVGGAKQLVSIAGESAVRRATRTALSSSCAETIVVIGHEAAAVAGEVADLEVRTAFNAAYASGQSGSVRVGVEAVSSDSEGALFMPCDQPLLNNETVEAILDAWRRVGGIAVPCHAGRRGAPVLFPRRLFAELAALEGDEGGRQILARHADAVVPVEVADAALDDFDTVEGLTVLLARMDSQR